MKISKVAFDSIVSLPLHEVKDNRGSFTRLFCNESLSEVLGDSSIVQINLSKTTHAGCVRGLHFQNPPSHEGKYIFCLKGEVYDVVVDVRMGSQTFLQHHCEVLTEGEKQLYYVPPGFAHGFQALVPGCELLYLHTNYYNVERERGIKFNDPMLSIDWPKAEINMSPKDLSYPNLTPSFKGIKI